jgi:starch phosphorylase
MDMSAIGARERFEAIAHSVRDVLSQRWIHTGKTYERQNAKRVYYLSMEFLIGRSLSNKRYESSSRCGGEGSHQG